ncbi:hypothetical protein SteCoe_8425 [Stentor coeruleus]|uniref:Uncharacterized protein n=1 Tax=Stentor coeruleus TaxID=5963 RepID=A0A1R2CKD8_9CILI|nr:hypothetical protein SteCoe_8425 [Stentor coeruleus]
MRRVLQRLFSEKLNFKLDPQQYVPRHVEKESKNNYSNTSKAQDMKKKFGKEYISAYEKWDLVVPRTDAIDGPKSQYRRLSEKSNFREARMVFYCLLAFFAFEVYRETSRYFKHIVDTKEVIELHLEGHLIKKAVSEKAEAIFDLRKQESEKFANDYKEKLTKKNS